MMQSLYKNYKYRVFPHIKDIRGTTYLKNKIELATLNGLEPYSGSPETIFSAGDWDNCIILDACRHDLYEQVNGPTPRRVSVGSHSADYIQNTYTDSFPGVVQVTGNPHFYKNIFSDLTDRNVTNVFKDVYHTYMDKWDEDYSTVLPEAVVADAMDAHKKYPDSKLVIHFMQPHYPFIKSPLSEGINLLTGSSNLGVWDLCERGEIEKDTVWNAYKENLEYVMPYVHQLADQINGKTVVTADHGNVVGENNCFGHPRGSEAKVLREVPWEVLSEGDGV